MCAVYDDVLSYTPATNCTPCKWILTADGGAFEGTDKFSLNVVVSRDGRNTTKIRLENPQVVVSVYGESLYCLAAINLYVEGYRHKGEIQAMTPCFSIFSCSALTLIMMYLAGSGQGKRDSPCHLFDCVILFVRPSKIPEQ